ncbi:MAG: tetratricopeptide repeat protein, partial [Waddliaceae bacterium]
MSIPNLSSINTRAPEVQAAGIGTPKAQVQQNDQNQGPTITKNLFDTMSILINSGRYQEALPYSKQILELTEENLGSVSLGTADSLNGVGCCLFGLKNIKKALDSHERALRIRQRILGDKHPAVAQSLYNLGCCLSALGENEKALEYHEKALEIRKETLGVEHFSLEASYYNINPMGELLMRYETF